MGARGKLFKFIDDLFNVKKPPVEDTLKRSDEVIEEYKLPSEPEIIIPPKLPQTYTDIPEVVKKTLARKNVKVFPELLETWRLNGEPVYLDKNITTPVGYMYKGILANIEPKFNRDYPHLPQILGDTGTIVTLKPATDATDYAEAKQAFEEWFAKHEFLEEKKYYTHSKQRFEAWPENFMADLGLYKTDTLEYARFQKDQSVIFDMPKRISSFDPLDDFEQDFLSKRAKAEFQQSPGLEIFGPSQRTIFPREGGNYLAKKYGFGGVVIQNPQLLAKFDLALDELSDITGLPKEVMGLGDTLTMLPDTPGSPIRGINGQYWSDVKLLENIDEGDALAHEWGHAFDNYLFDKFLKPNIAGEKLAQKGKPMLTHAAGTPFAEDTRDELRDIFIKVHEKFNDTNSFFYNVSLQADKGLPQAYYTQPTEMLARVFDAWVFSKKGYVPGLTKNHDLDKLNMKYPLPAGNELKSYFALFDDLFAKLKSRKTTDAFGKTKWELYVVAPIAVGSFFAAENAQAGWMPNKQNTQMYMPAQSGWMPTQKKSKYWMPGTSGKFDFTEELSSMVKTSQRGLSLIQTYEGFRPTVYKDPVGLPTIGFGHLLKEGEHFSGGVTREEAQDLMVEDLLQAEDAIEKLVAVALTENQHAALASFVYNVGVGNFQNSTLLKRLNQGDYQGAGDQLLRWTKGKTKTGFKDLSGLVKRRKAERELFLT